MVTAENAREVAQSHFWNPMARLPDVMGKQKVWVRGEQSTVYDEKGRAFIDATASLWYMNVGYGRQEIVDAVAEQMKSLAAYGLFGDNLTLPPVELAELVASLAPGDLNRTFFACDGSEAVETAIKIARQHFRLVGEPYRYKIIARRTSYHGVTLGALGATGTVRNRRRFDPLPIGFLHVPPLDPTALEELIEFEGADTVAAFIAEPIMGAAGVVVPPDDYFPRVHEICQRNGILLISDEVISGFGRLGHWFGIEHWNVVPDLMTMAKGITSGYIPLGAVAVSDKVAAPFLDPDDPDNGFFHGNTYSGHATACAAAIANIEIIRREGLVERARDNGTYLHEALSEAMSDQSLVKEVRGGVGLMAAVNLDASESSQISRDVAREAYERGVLVRPMTGNTVTLSPPFVIEREEIDQVADALHHAVANVSASLSAGGEREQVGSGVAGR